LFLEGKIKKLAPRSKLQEEPQHPEIPTTWKLRESIHHKKNTNQAHSYRIGVPFTMEYGEYQEYGTRHIPPRSYLRRWLLEYSKETEQYFEQLLYRYSR
jgi:hypothetical protein